MLPGFCWNCFKRLVIDPLNPSHSFLKCMTILPETRGWSTSTIKGLGSLIVLWRNILFVRMFLGCSGDIGDMFDVCCCFGWKARMTDIRSMRSMFQKRLKNIMCMNGVPACVYNCIKTHEVSKCTTSYNIQFHLWRYICFLPAGLLLQFFVFSLETTGSWGMWSPAQTTTCSSQSWCGSCISRRVDACDADRKMFEGCSP